MTEQNQIALREKYDLWFDHWLYQQNATQEAYWGFTHHKLLRVRNKARNQLLLYKAFIGENYFKTKILFVLSDAYWRLGITDKDENAISTVMRTWDQEIKRRGTFYEVCRLLNDMQENASFPRDIKERQRIMSDCAVTELIKCAPIIDKDEKARGIRIGEKVTAYKHGLSILLEEIRLLEPKFILFLAGIAAFRVLKEELRRAFNIIENELQFCKSLAPHQNPESVVIFGYHPSSKEFRRTRSVILDEFLKKRRRS